jgi:hypothetical protein
LFSGKPLAEVADAIFNAQQCKVAADFFADFRFYWIYLAIDWVDIEV